MLGSGRLPEGERGRYTRGLVGWAASLEVRGVGNINRLSLLACAPESALGEWFSHCVGQCSLAGGAASWYFAPNDEKLSPSHTLAGIKNTFLYHQGSVAFGSLIVALVQLVKYYLLYLAKQAEQQ